MINLFSQIIHEHWKLRYKAAHRCKDVPTEIIPQHIEDKIDGIYPEVMYCHVISTLSYVAEDAAYLVCTNRDVRNVMEWVCNNIVSKITKDSRKTFNVKLRIAVGMINKLEDKGIDKMICLFYYDNIITNCNDLWMDYAFDGQLDQLPF